MANSETVAHGATVADVARVARVSKATAARALGGYGTVSEETRRRVLDAADAVGYLPNSLARTMSTGRSETIGVVLSDIENPFFAKAARSIDDVARSAGFDVILCNTDEDVAKEASAIDLLLRKRVAGVIIAPASKASSGVLARARDQTPVVLFDRAVDDLALDTVVADNRRGGFELTSVLTEAGHRRVAFISTLEQDDYRDGQEIHSSSVADRVAGFHEALDQARIANDERLVLLNGRREGIQRVISSALDAGVTAIVASDSLIAQDVLHVARKRALQIPSDFSMVAFDDADWTELSTPTITVMAQPINMIGAEAARLLVRRLEGRDDPPRTVVLDQTLIRRESVGRPRVSASRS